MSLNLDFFNRKTNISAKVVADSISEAGQRITTLEVELPRIVLAEMNTHHDIMKNCSSTRAITLAKAIEQVEQNGFEPVYWGKNKSGMAASEELEDIYGAKVCWDLAKDKAVMYTETLCDRGLHKQIAGRLLEPFQMVKQVLTATNWDNFFNLRIHPTAQPEILMLAYKIYKAIEASKPTMLKSGEWHLPYVDRGFEVTFKGDTVTYHVGDFGIEGFKYLTLEEAKRISASCCAQTSYRNTDDSLEKADSIFDMLVNVDVIHSSPAEHQATPIKRSCDVMGVNNYDPATWEDGVTHMNRNGVVCSGGLVGWIQHRHLIPKNTCYKFNFEERMGLFKG